MGKRKSSAEYLRRKRKNPFKRKFADGTRPSDKNARMGKHRTKEQINAGKRVRKWGKVFRGVSRQKKARQQEIERAAAAIKTEPPADNLIEIDVRLNGNELQAEQDAMEAVETSEPQPSTSQGLPTVEYQTDPPSVIEIDLRKAPTPKPPRAPKEFAPSTMTHRTRFKNFEWSENAIRTFIQLRLEYRYIGWRQDKVDRSGLWREVAAEMKKRLNLPMKIPTVVLNEKWRYLEQKYNEINERTSSKEEAAELWEYYKDMDLYYTNPTYTYHASVPLETSSPPKETETGSYNEPEPAPEPKAKRTQSGKTLEGIKFFIRCADERGDRMLDMLETFFTIQTQKTDLIIDKLDEISRRLGIE